MSLGIDVRFSERVGWQDRISRGVSRSSVIEGRESTAVVERSFASPEVREVAVANGVGDVAVAAQGTGNVHARVLKRSTRGQAGLEDHQVDIDLVDGILHVSSTLDQGSFFSSGETPRSDVTITVPESGPGPVITSLESDLGDLTLLGTGGDTAVHTNLGDVTASGVDGYLSLSSDLGTILATDVTGIDAIHTDLGSIKVDVLGLRADTEIGTDLGEVTIGVAHDLDVDLLAVATDGIDSNLPLTDHRTVGGRVTGRLNDGGHRLRVFSELGDVSLRSISAQ